MRVIVKAVYPEAITLAEALLEGFKQTEIGLLRFALKISDNVYKDSSIKLLKLAEGKILKLLQDEIKKNRIPLDIEKLSFEKEGENGIKAVAAIKNVKYKEIVLRYLPQFIEKVAKGEEGGTISEIAELLKDEQEKIISSVLDEIEDEKKELIISLLVKKYHGIVCKELTKLTAMHGIQKLTIEEICVECEKNEERLH